MADISDEAIMQVFHREMGGSRGDDALHFARAVLALKPAVPEGWRLVPEVPTQDMRDTGKWEMSSACEDVYAAMLAAAPQHGGE